MADKPVPDLPLPALNTRETELTKQAFEARMQQVMRAAKAATNNGVATALMAEHDELVALLLRLKTLRGT